jgi:hypothetical protein
LEELLELVRNHGIPLPPDSEDLGRLTPFGAVFRYGDTPEEDRKLPEEPWLRGAVQRTLDWATRHLLR